MYPYSPSHLVYTSVHDQRVDQRIQRKDFPGIKTHDSELRGQEEAAYATTE